MRILAIRGENLASLQGGFALELDAPPLAGQGLVAVTGPTGAGKSTLLDALCLALFDRTPRLRGRGGTAIGFVQPEDREELSSADPRCLIRRGAVEARAEVEFLGKLGRRYLATWRVRRARRASTGRLQDQSLELHDLTLGQRLGGHRKSDVLGAIQEALGLDWAAFGRAALLAQGEFAAFLRADPGARAELLERVTGTALYSRVSMAAHRRAGEAARALAAVEERRAALAPLPDEVRAALLSRREAVRAEREAARAERDAASEALRHLRAVEEAAREEGRAAAALRDAEAAWAAAGPQREALAEAEALEPLRGLLDALDRAAGAREAAAAELRQVEAAAEGAQTEAERWRARAGEARAWLEAHPQRRALGEQWPRWRAHLEVCVQVAAALERAAREAPALGERAQAAGREVAACRARASAAQAARDEAERAQAAARAALPRSPSQARAALAADEQALAGFWPLAERALRAATAAARTRQEVLAATEEAQEAQRALEELAGRAPALLARRDEAARAREAARAALDLESRRGELRPDAPCPLCGSVEHPWADERPPLAGLVLDATARLDELERALEALRLAEADGKARLAAARARHEGARETGRAAAAELDAARQGWSERRAQLAGRVPEGLELPLDPCPPGAADPADVADPGDAGAVAEQALEALRGRLARDRAALLQAEQAEERAREALDQARSEEARAREALATAEAAQRAAADACAELERSRAQALERRRQAEAELAEALTPATTSPGTAPGAPGGTTAGDEAHLDLPLFATRRRAGSPPGEAEAEAEAEPWRAELRADPAGFLAARRAEVEAWQTHAAALRQAETALGPSTAAASAAAARLAERRQALARAEAELTACRADLFARLERLSPPVALAHLRLVLDRDAGWAARARAELARLERRGHEAAARLELLRLRRLDLERRAPPGLLERPGRAALEQALDAAGQREAAAGEALAKVEADLVHDERLRAELAALEPERQTRLTAQATWGRLGELIGSHDGRKLRLFAQGLGLDALLEHTNAYLQRLAPRYQLLRAPGQDLELQLLDRELGDEVRPVSGLSGGESFLVSLGLALGLSSLHAGGTRIESLFIDEGLGALDPLAQEQALATLDALQADGRQVVLITHLPGIAERLGPGVRLIPEAQGRSRVVVG
mgnify:CR=1 FL=1